MKKGKKICSWLLIWLMLLTLLPADAKASSIPPEGETEYAAVEDVKETSEQKVTETEEEKKVELQEESTEAVDDTEKSVDNIEDKIEEKTEETTEETTVINSQDAIAPEIVEEKEITDETDSGEQEQEADGGTDKEEDEESFDIVEDDLNVFESTDHPPIGTIQAEGEWGNGYIWYVRESKADVRHYVFCMDHGSTMRSGIYKFSELNGQYGSKKNTFRMAVAMSYFKAQGGYHSNSGYADAQAAIWNSGYSDTSKHLITYANHLWELTEVNGDRASSASSYKDVSRISKSKADSKSFGGVSTVKKLGGSFTNSDYFVKNKKITISGSAWKYFASGAGGWSDGIEVVGCYKPDGSKAPNNVCNATVRSDGNLVVNLNPKRDSEDPKDNYGYNESSAITILMRVNQTYQGATSITYLDCGSGKQHMCSEMSANSPAYFALKVYAPRDEKYPTVGINKIDEFGNPIGGLQFNLIGEYGTDYPSYPIISDPDMEQTFPQIKKAGKYTLTESGGEGFVVPDILKTGIDIYASEEISGSTKKIVLNCPTALPEGFSVVSSDDRMQLSFTIPNRYDGGNAEMKKTGDLLSGYEGGRFIYTSNYLSDVYFDLYTAEDIMLGETVLWPAHTKLTQEYVDSSIWVTQNGAKVRTVSIPEKTSGDTGFIRYENLPYGNYYMVENMDRNTYQRKFFPDNIDFTVKYGTTQINGGEYINKLVTAAVNVKKVTGTGDSTKPLQGAEFTLYASADNKNWRDETYFDKENDTTPAVIHRDKDGTETIVDYQWVPLEKAVSDENGNAPFEIQVPYGDYMIVETKAPDGYALAAGDSYRFTHEYDSEEDYSSGAFYHAVITDEETSNLILVRKYGELLTSAENRTSDYGSYSGLKFKRQLAAGIKFNIYDKDNNLVDTIITDENGEALSKNLDIGTYTVTEVDNGGGMKLAESREVTIEKDQTKQVQVKELNFENKKLTTSFKIHKQAEQFEKANKELKEESETDSLYSYPLKPMSGVVFGVYTKGDIKNYKNEVIVKADSCVGYAVTDDDGIATFNETLVNGGYYYSEIKTAGELYIKDDGIYDFNVKLSGENLVTDLNQNSPVINYMKKGSIKVIKTDGTTKKPLQGVEFTLYDSNMDKLGTFITDNNGQITISKLPISKYYIQETKTVDGYKLDTDIHELAMTLKTFDLTLNVKNYENKKGSIRVIKTDGDTEELLEGVEFTLYDKDKRAIKTYSTDENGEIYVSGLELFTYYIKETKGLDGYKVDNTMHELTLTEEKYDLTLNVENYKKKKDTSIVVTTITTITGGGKVKTGDISLFVWNLMMFSTALCIVLSKRKRRRFVVNDKTKRHFFSMLLILFMVLPGINVKADTIAGKNWSVMSYDMSNVAYSYYSGTANTLDGMDGEVYRGPLIVIDVETETNSVDLDKLVLPVMQGKIAIDEKGSFRNIPDAYYITGSLTPNYGSMLLINVKPKRNSEIMITGSLSTLMNEEMKLNRFGYVRIKVEADADVRVDTNIIPTSVTDIICQGNVVGINGGYSSKDSFNSAAKVDKVNVRAKSFSGNIFGGYADYNLYWNSYDPLNAGGTIFTTVEYIDPEDPEFDPEVGPRVEHISTLTVHPLSRTGYHVTGQVSVDSGVNGNFVLNNSFIADNYTITLNYVDDSGKQSKKYSAAYDSEYTFLSVPVRTGYTFTGYTRSDGVEVNTRSVVDLAADHTITANYRVNKYLVQFDSGEGNTTTKSKLVTYDAIYGELPVPERMGYDFEGWYMDDRQITASDTVSTAQAHTFTARYSPKTVTVELDPDGGDCNIDTIQVVSGEVYGTLPVPVKNGYSFEGWYLNNDRIDETTKLSESNYYLHTYGIALTAHWKSTASDTSSPESKVSSGNSVSEDSIISDTSSQTNSDVKGDTTVEIGKQSESEAAVIRPSVKSFKVKNIKGRKIRVSLKGENITGYQIRYSGNKSLSGAKTIDTAKQIYKIGKLKKGKTYYVRVRAYSTSVDGERIYSEWTGTKKVKVKR